MSKNYYENNKVFIWTRMIKYPNLVFTKRNNNIPRPERLDNEYLHFCRIPWDKHTIVWMFDSVENAARFRKEWAHIVVDENDF